MDASNLENSREILGELKKEEKKRGRKAKKQNEKELINEYYSEIEKDKQYSNQKKIYENMNYMSKQDKLQFESKFTKPKNKHQEQFVSKLKNKEKKIVVVTGPAGTGKTYLAVAKAVQALQSKQVTRIILTRPAVEAGERLGFLPGTLSEKIDPYLRPLYDALHDMVDPDSIPRLMTSGTIEVAPLAYMRGRTLNDAFIILDEAQNTSAEQMKMFLTRLGFGSTMVITGDVTQIDLPSGTASGLRVVRDILTEVDDVAFCKVTSTDVVRHKLVGQIVDAYGRYDEKRASQDQRPDRRNS